MRYVIDIETNGLIADMCDFRDFPYILKDTAKLWVVCIKNIDTKETFTLKGKDLTKKNIKKILKDAKELIGHNILKFDLQALRLFGLIDYKIGYLNKESFLFNVPCEFTDTLIWSRLFYTDRFGGHSLKAWGDRLGLSKIDYKKALIEKGVLDAGSKAGYEFSFYDPTMDEYCRMDVEVTELIYKELYSESKKKEWQLALKQESILAHLSVFRENFGFGFNKKLALENVEKLTSLMENIRLKINPLLPPRKLNKTESKSYIPPKKQLDSKGNLTKIMTNFAKKHEADIILYKEKWTFIYNGKKFILPFTDTIEKTITADIDDLDHVKMYLISLGWEPTEWRERDLTKDSKKQNLSYIKRVAALDRWWNDTINGKYLNERINYMDMPELDIYPALKSRLMNSKPVMIPTSPMIRVGVTKDICPNLIAIGEKVEFAKDFADYLTYKHRKSCIAGGDIEDMDFDEESPNTGYLSNYREEDGRVPTPAIEVGAASFRYKHIFFANVPRVTSLFGEEMRSMFIAGKNHIQFGWDYSSLEARIMGNYVYKYEDGDKMAEMLLAEKPNDWHCFDNKTQILTENGWLTFNKITEDMKVAQWSNKEISFVHPTDIIWQKYTGPMISFNSRVLSKVVTPNHRILHYKLNENSLDVSTAEEVYNWLTPRSIPIVGLHNGKVDLPEDFIKLLIATHDFATLENETLSYTIKNPKIVKRLIGVLTSLGIKFIPISEKRILIIMNYNFSLTKLFDYLDNDLSYNYSLIDISIESKEFFINELKYWKSFKSNYQKFFIKSSQKSSEVIQTISHLCNQKCTSSKLQTKNKKNLYKTTILSILKDTVSIGNIKNKEIILYDDYIGCVTVPSGYIMVKRDGHIFISGNSKTAEKIGISRNETKSLNYGLIYGSQITKVMKMLACTRQRATEIFNGAWDAMPALKELRVSLENFWEKTGKKYIIGIDGRKVFTRSKHSLLNFLFQSAGVICTKYVFIKLFEKYESLGYNIDPFNGKPDVISMIEYHDECQFATKNFYSFRMFDTEQGAKDFVASWEGGQLSTIGKGKKYWYVALPNSISENIIESLDEISKMFDLKVPLSMEYSLGRNWKECH